MARFYGKVGYRVTSETAPGVWRPQILTRNYYGDLVKNRSSIGGSESQEGGKVNDDIRLSNNVSIVADGFAYENFHNIIYVEYLGAKWKVNSVEVQRPRLILTLGGIYSGDSA